MYGANRLALGILLFWGAGFLFFFAFHPGGVQIFDADADHGKGAMRGVRNPAELLGYLMEHHPGE